jgi:hypothetical protein
MRKLHPHTQEKKMQCGKNYCIAIQYKLYIRYFLDQIIFLQKYSDTFVTNYTKYRDTFGSKYFLYRETFFPKYSVTHSNFFKRSQTRYFFQSNKILLYQITFSDRSIVTGKFLFCQSNILDNG